MRDKKIHELRAIASAMGVKFTFGQTKEALIQAIELAQEALVYREPLPQAAPVPEVTGSRQDEIKALLAEFVTRGLRITFPDSFTFALGRGEKGDSGHLSTPNHAIVEAAQRCM